MTILLSQVALSLLPVALPSYSVFTDVSAFAYTENNSIYSLVAEDGFEYNRSSNILTINELSVGTQMGKWTLSYIHRYDWLGKFSEDTMAFYGRLDNSKDDEENKTYNLDLEINHINTRGLRIAYQQPFTDGRLYLAASYLQAIELMDGSIKGYASEHKTCKNSQECYKGNIQVDYVYSKDSLFDRQVNAPKSRYGFGFDLGADWQFTKNWFGSIYIQDLYSEILWDYAPYTEATINTVTREGSNGNITYTPAVSGYEGNKDYIQKLPTKYKGIIAYTPSLTHSFYTQAFYTYEALLYHIGYNYKPYSASYGIKYYPEQHALGVSIKASNFKFSATGDPKDPLNSELIEINAGVSFSF